MKEEFKIIAQTQAEKDKYLIDCFYDSGIAKQLIQSEFSILAGRKGAGKTAIARYIEEKYYDLNLLDARRISITSFSEERSRLPQRDVKEGILIYILLRAAKNLFDGKFLDNTDYWKAVFEQEKIGEQTSYEDFRTVKKTNNVGFSAGIQGQLQEERVRTEITLTADSLFHSIVESLERKSATTLYLYLIDDLSDYLDDIRKEQIKEDLAVISDVLFRLDAFNTESQLKKHGIRFVACIRDDLFEFMQGSNINKLRENTLPLYWNEEGFLKLIIRRLPHFEERKDEALAHPQKAIQELFPDDLFESRIRHFKTNRYATKFYAYMVAISFNRPRDFLKFCYALRLRLSLKNKVISENITAAETEYADYFYAEIKDEFFLASQVFGLDSDENFIPSIIDILASREDFNSSQLRTSIAPLIKEKTSIGRKRIELFIYRLWWYGILGYKESKEADLIRFRYINPSDHLIPDQVDKFFFYLHSGLHWFVQKRRQARVN